jgi:two-component system phosphate regulon sensor histidine kinase PhoR
MGYRRIVQLLVYLGIVPAVLLSAMGVLLLVVGEAQFNLLIGILVLTFAATSVTGVILVWVFLRRERNLSQLQADFVSKVSHELRTPLTSVRMFAETLKIRRGDEATRERCIEAIDRESARLQALIDRLLDWGRMESGMRRYDLAEHDVRAIVDEAVSAFEPTREQREVSLQVDIPAELPRVVCDRGAIVDAVVNLLSNAYKYGGNPPQITISANEARGRVNVTVRDNGPGIALREQTRIFQKFYRIDDKLTRTRDGSGLGLAIVEHVMKGHHGRVRVESAPGQGSAFTLEFAPPSVAQALRRQAGRATSEDEPARQGAST